MTDTVDYPALVTVLLQENNVLRERIAKLEEAFRPKLIEQQSQQKPDEVFKEYLEIVWKHSDDALMTIRELATAKTKPSYRDVVSPLLPVAPPPPSRPAVIGAEADLRSAFLAMPYFPEPLVDSVLRFLCARTPFHCINTRKLLEYWSEHPYLRKRAAPEGHIKFRNLPAEFELSPKSVTLDQARVYYGRPDLVSSSGEFIVVQRPPPKRWVALVKNLHDDAPLLKALVKSMQTYLSTTKTGCSTLPELERHLGTNARFVSLLLSVNANYNLGGLSTYAVPLAAMGLSEGTKFVIENEGFLIRLTGQK